MEIFKIASIIVLTVGGLYTLLLMHINKKFGIRFTGIPGTPIQASASEIKTKITELRDKNEYAFKRLRQLLLLYYLTKYGWLILMISFMVYLIGRFIL